MERSIVQRFQAMVERYGDHLAIKEGERQLSYRLLDRDSDGLAAALLEELGTGSEPLALMFKHGVEPTLAQLAVLKAGKFYAHLDPELAEARQRLLLENLGARVLLCDEACQERASLLALQLPQLRVMNTAALPCKGKPLTVPIQASDPALIVYTSGSTGEPQGVLLSHQNVLMIARSHGRDFGLSPADRASQLCPLGSAASASETFSALLNGASIYPFSIKEGGVFALLKLLGDEAVTTFTGTPILFRMLFSAAGEKRRFPAMRLIRLGGDKTSRQDLALFKRVFDEHCLLRLGYGSSEYLLVTQFFIDKQYEMDGAVAPVGFPMEGCELRLLDAEQQEVACGQLGEIAVSSAYLSLGYWRNEALTRQRFLTLGKGSGLRCYLTRDIGFLDEQGCLYYVGRSDSRVKIYGKMVLMTDVEEALLAIEGVKEAVVLPYDSGERGTELAAFVVGEGLDEAGLRRCLRAALPAELIPRKFRLLDRMPLQINNKINRLQLRELARGGEGLPR